MPSKNNSQVAMAIGSDSDLQTMRSCIDRFANFGVTLIVRVIFAPAAVMAAHLAGVKEKKFETLNR